MTDHSQPRPDGADPDEIPRYVELVAEMDTTYRALQAALLAADACTEQWITANDAQRLAQEAYRQAIARYEFWRTVAQ